MTQYDAGPGEWSDREWESPDRKRMRHAKRRGPILPPWALLAIVVGIVILLSRIIQVAFLILGCLLIVCQFFKTLLIVRSSRCIVLEFIQEGVVQLSTPTLSPTS